MNIFRNITLFNMKDIKDVVLGKKLGIKSA